MNFEEIILNCFSSIAAGFLIYITLIIIRQNWVNTVHYLITFLLLPPITFIITNVISNNLALSLGMIGALSIVLGVILSFFIGAIVAVLFGYTDPVSITTIGAGAATYIVGPVTGTALSASADVIALSIAVGLIKSILVMIITPFVAPFIKLNNPHTAMIFGGLMGTTSGVAGGLAATDPKLVPYGAMTATFYTGAGCLMAPSVLYLIINLMF